MDGKPRNRKEFDKQASKEARKRAKVAREDDLIAQHLRKREAKSELKASLTKIGKYETTDRDNAQVPHMTIILQKFKYSFINCERYNFSPSIFVLLLNIRYLPRRLPQYAMIQKAPMMR
jgi:predicted nuclease of restriction endonuclease-like (RecB) superfamily